MRLAHFTDVHLLALDKFRLSDYVNKRWAGGLNILLNRGHSHSTEVFAALVDDLNAQGIEQVACTGDLTNLSLESEFRFARSQFDRIAVGPRNVACVPGNHDNYVTEVAGLFEKTFAPYMVSDDGFGWPDADPWPTTRLRDEVALIGVTTSQPSGLLFGHGEIGKKQLVRLEERLADPRLDERMRIVVMHHPSAGRHAASFRRGLRDHEAFGALIARTGAELILHGHEHLDLRNTLRGPGGVDVPVHGVQSGSYAGHTERKRARYRVYTIARGEGRRPSITKIDLRGWTATKQGFMPEA